MVIEVLIVVGRADKGRYVFGLSGGSLLGGREGRNKGGILDGGCLGWARGIKNMSRLQKNDFLSVLSPRDVNRRDCRTRGSE